ncbi:doublesex and mab-3 related transcription factor 1-like [Paralichthys olivaceus]|uniref:doublesex and mab-3 related transcription factor 1-like n=1 Tax=Paralichthys olivaceus TaxID=8255 RepID=UPI0037516E2B
MSSTNPRRRELKCPRCRQHGIITPLRNHQRLCPFLWCDCLKCFQISLRDRVSSAQRRRREPQDPEQRPGAPSTPAAPREAPPSAASPGPAAAPWSSADAGVALDLRARAPRREDRVTRQERREERPITPTAAINAQVHHFPYRMPAHYPASFPPHPNFYFYPLWIPSVPAAIYNCGLPGPNAHCTSPPGAGPLALCSQFLFIPSPPEVPYTPPPLEAMLTPLSEEPELIIEEVD